MPYFPLRRTFRILEILWPQVLTLIFIVVYSLRIMEDSFHRRINKHCVYNHIINWFIFTWFFKVSVEMFKVGLIYENLFATVFLELL